MWVTTSTEVLGYCRVSLRDMELSGLHLQNPGAIETFLSAGEGGFQAAQLVRAVLESPVNRPAGRPALRARRVDSDAESIVPSPPDL
jgi:hypothetical protein